MNILFIGGAGFIGSSLVKRFVSDRKYLVFILEPEFANISRLNGMSDERQMYPLSIRSLQK